MEGSSSNENCQGNTCVSILTSKSGTSTSLRRLQPGRTILSSKLTVIETGHSYVKSRGSQSALSDLTNTINASRKRLKSIFQNTGDDRFVRFLSKDFENISVIPSSLNKEGCSYNGKRCCSLEVQSTVGGHSKHRRLEEQHLITKNDMLHWNEENRASFEVDSGTNIANNIAKESCSSRKTTISNNKENGCTSTARRNDDFFLQESSSSSKNRSISLHLPMATGNNLQEDNQLCAHQDSVPEAGLIHCSQKNSAKISEEVGTNNGPVNPQYSTATPTRCTSAGLENIDIPGL
ncbi:hypothetical protein RIF29_00696 [Crotalaria pallida]|uniref:Uncharacterized protein n=1 Tax=Crotalaria pallida TaxID=3830 RepID=A0AAN9P7C7_CROPI